MLYERNGCNAKTIEEERKIDVITFDNETNVAAINAEHDQVLIESLIKLYHQKAPSVSWESYQEGLQAGIRYALLATKNKIPGINA